MKKILSVFAAAIYAKFNDFSQETKKPNRIIVKNPYPKRPGIWKTAMRDITPLTKYKASSHLAHQGEKECARRVRQMAKGMDHGQRNFKKAG